LRNIVATLLIAFLATKAFAQKQTPPAPAQVAQEIREYRMDNEERIMRELSEFLAIPNIASDTSNIQKNAAHLVEMLEARGVEAHLLPITGRGPVVYGKLISPEAKRTVIFYAHYDGQPVDPTAFRFHQIARNAVRSITTIGGFTRVRPRMINRQSWRCWQRSMRCERRRFRWL